MIVELLRRGATTLWVGLRHFHRDRCFDLSATVAFYSLLSLGPLLYLIGSTLGLFVDETDTVRSAIDRLSPFVPPEVSAALQRLTRNLKAGEGLVLLALPGLLWIATSAFSALERAINVAFGRKTGRELWRTRLKAFLVMSVGGMLLGGSLIAATLLPRLDRWRAAMELPEAPGGVTRLGSQGLLWAASFFIFALFYKTLPHGRVGWRAAAGGAGVALVLWEAARHLFGRLLTGATAFGLLTGTLAGIVTFLLWIYTAVAVTLLGAELASVMNGDRPEARD